MVSFFFFGGGGEQGHCLSFWFDTKVAEQYAISVFKDNKLMSNTQSDHTLVALQWPNQRYMGWFGILNRWW